MCPLGDRHASTPSKPCVVIRPAPWDDADRDIEGRPRVAGRTADTLRKMARAPSTEETTRPETAGGAEGLTPPTGHVWVLGTVVMAALMAAAVLPIGVLVRERPVRREIEQVIDPARQHVAAIRSAIERSVASHAAYMLSGNPVLLARADDWRARQERETAL